MYTERVDSTTGKNSQPEQVDHEHILQFHRLSIDFNLESAIEDKTAIF